MTHKKIELSISGLIRETLGLIAYNNILKNIFMNENTDIQSYYACLKKLRKYFKIKDENEHTNSSSDSNSDNNSEIIVIKRIIINPNIVLFILFIFKLFFSISYFCN